MSDDNDQPYGVWRISEAAGTLRAEIVWRNAAGMRKMSLSADGHTAWFDGGTEPYVVTDLISYDVETRRVTRRPVTLPGGRNSALSDLHWVLAGDQLPTVFNPYHRLDDKEANNNLLDSRRLALLRPAMPPTTENETWVFNQAFASARQSILDARIWPVRWRSTKTFWIEDLHGIAELDAFSGRVIRALAMPQRSGVLNSDDAGGASEHVPEPLGSPEANWIAAGFLLTVRDNKNIPPSLEPHLGRFSDRFVGMHVIDLKEGYILSALLGGSDTLQAAARSANGRFLALGSNGISGDSSAQVVVWDIAQKRTPVRLDTSQFKGEIFALAFSWDGAQLWAMGRGKLYRWHLPEQFRDAASKGSFPDQSRN